MVAGAQFWEWTLLQLLLPIQADTMAQFKELDDEVQAIRDQLQVCVRVGSGTVG
jgi:hypothetical protein